VNAVLETAGPVSGVVRGEPVTVLPLVAVTVMVLAELETVLPRLSVTATLDLTVPELPRVVIVQVKRQGEPIVPALTVRPLKASRLAAPAETVRGREAEVEMVPSLAVTPAVSALFSFVKPFLDEAGVATPEVKLSAVAVPKLIAVPALLTTVGMVPLGLAVAPAKVMFLAPA
jgi:hypothetical protein